MEPEQQSITQQNNITNEEKTRPNTMIRIESSEKINQKDNHQNDSQKNGEIHHGELVLTAIVIESENSLKTIPKGQPTYYDFQSQQEMKNLKITYSVCSFFIICSLILRVIPQFIFEGCLISACVWIFSFVLFLFNAILFYGHIKNQRFLTLTLWMILNSLYFICDLIGTILAFQSPLFNDCSDQQNDCHDNSSIKNTFSIVNVVSLLMVGIMNGFFIYKGYQIRELKISQKKLSNIVPVSHQIEI